MFVVFVMQFANHPLLEAGVDLVPSDSLKEGIGHCVMRDMVRL